MQGCVLLPQQNCCGWDGSPGANSPTLPRCGAQRALIHTVLLCGVSDTAALWGWLGDNARSGSTSLGLCMGDGGKLLRAALPLSPVQDVPVAVPCPSPGGARIGGGVEEDPVSRSAASSKLEHLQRVGPGTLQEPHVPYVDSRVPSGCDGAACCQCCHVAVPGQCFLLQDLAAISFTFCVLCRNIPPPLPSVISLSMQDTHQSLLRDFTSLAQISGSMHGICR